MRLALKVARATIRYQEKPEAKSSLFGGRISSGFVRKNS
jgi:hypothetical protein